MWKLSTKNQAHQHLLPLGLCQNGQEVTIQMVLGGRKLHNRINELGLTPGTIIRIIQASRRGPVVIQLRGSIIALGQRMAHHLLVN